MTLQDLAWNSSRIEALKQYWAKGLTCTQIAKELGSTRSAVAGKARRLNLEPRFVMPAAPKPILRERQKANGMVRRGFIRPAPPLQIVASIPADEPSPCGCSLLELKPGHCKFPIGFPGEPGFHFCARETDGTYCLGHRELCRRKPEDGAEG